MSQSPECNNKDGSDFTGAAEITDEQLRKALADRPNLNKLVLVGCKNLTSKGLKHVMELATKLEYLDVSKSTVDMEGLNLVQKITTLKTLKIKGCERIPGAYTEEFCSARPDCVVFDKSNTWSSLRAERQRAIEYYRAGGLPRWGH